MEISRNRPVSPTRRLRWWFALATAAILLCVVIVAVIAVATASSRSSTDVADETVRRIGERTAELMLGHLDDAVESAEAIAIGATDEQLAERGPELDRLLAIEVTTIPQISGAFIGFPDGTFRFVTRRDGQLFLRRIDTSPTRTATEGPLGPDLQPLPPDPLDTDYDPTARPWYELAIDTNESSWTDPYVFFSSRQPGVTLSQPIRSDRGELIAVVGIDVSLSELSAFLSDLPIVEEADAFIIAGDRVVAAPPGYDLGPVGDDELELSGLDQLGIDDDLFRRLRLGTEPVQTSDGGRLQVIDLIGEDAPRWEVLVQTGRPEISAEVDRVARWSILIILITGGILLASVPLLTRRLRHAMDELDRRARIDTLTDVLNRGAFLDAADAALEDAKRTGRELTLALLDVDDFKQINDELGHPSGDEALVALGNVLLSCVRENDLVGRIGGDEFALVFRGTDRPVVDSALARVQERLAHQAIASPERPRSSVTVGVSARRGRAVGLTDLIAEADGALLDAKHSRKGSISWSTEHTDDTVLQT